MKKIIYFILCIVIVSGVSSGCGKKTFSIKEMSEDLTTIKIEDLTTGTVIDLDEAQAGELFHKLKNIEYTREKSSKDNSEGSYSLEFSREDRVIVTYTVISEDTIDYNGYFYKDESSAMDMEYFDLLFGKTFQAEVIENGDSLLVMPNLDSSEFKSSDKIAVGTKDAQIIDLEGNEIGLEEIKVGDIIEIFYNGVILESYPAQISCDSIKVVEYNILIDGYMAAIDDIYAQDIGLNSDISIIALDMTEVTNLTLEEKGKLFARIEEKYGMEVIEGTSEELSEDGLIDTENYYFTDGILITITEPVYDEKEKTITYIIRKWRGLLGSIGYEAVVQYDGTGWNLTKGSMWIS